MFAFLCLQCATEGQQFNRLIFLLKYWYGTLCYWSANISRFITPFMDFLFEIYLWHVAYIVWGSLRKTFECKLTESFECKRRLFRNRRQLNFFFSMRVAFNNVTSTWPHCEINGPLNPYSCSLRKHFFKETFCKLILWAARTRFRDFV